MFKNRYIDLEIMFMGVTFAKQIRFRMMNVCAGNFVRVLN